jgi:glycosyltransferase involved in cell wall biosynthesis
MNIAVISIYSFPFGLAPTNRILAYTKGMVANGANVTVYLPFPTDIIDFSKMIIANKGNFEEINYFYSSGRYKSKYKILRGLAVLSGYRKLKGYFTSLYILRKNAIIRPIDCLIISTDLIPSLFVFAVIAKIIKSKSVFIFDEYPTPIRHKLKKRIPCWKELLYTKVLRLIDGYVSISENLNRYFNNLCLKKSLVLSTITDISRYETLPKMNKENPFVEYICYMGNMELSKDNVDIIIKAFYLISGKYPQLQLHLYGSLDYKTIIILETLIHDLKLTGKVFIKGIANYYDVPVILKSAKVLVSSQPETIRASGGFPTKLGEYLASGVPSLITDVGENSKYVTDDTHIFLTKPHDHKAYSEKLSYILENYDHALEVAANGKEYLLNNCSYIIKGRELLEFIDNLILV